MGACGVSCVKYLVFLFNLLFALSGIAILSVGIFIVIQYYHYNAVVGSMWYAPILMIVVGSVVFVIAFLGCCGAVKESSFMVLTFCILLLVIFLCELGIGIAGYIKHGELEGVLNVGFNKTFTDYKYNEVFWDKMQKELNCCGVNGPSDYVQIFHNSSLPAGCCSEFPGTEIRNNCAFDRAHKNGCMPILLNFLQSKSLILGSVGIGIALAQLIGISYACCLYRAFRRNYETV